MRIITAALAVCLLGTATETMAQNPQAQTTVPAAAVNPLTEDSRGTYGGVRFILLRSAAVMPEEKYAFRPTDAVRSFGQILGHVADAQYTFCSVVLGEKNPALQIEKNVTSKADLIASLEQAFAYCDRAYSGMNDQNAVEMVRLMGSDKPKLGVLSINSIHTIEHYGNLVTYLRMNDIVPPTSDPDFLQQVGRK